MAKNRSDRKKKIRIIISAVIIIILSAAVIGYDFYRKVYSPNISEWENDEKFIYIPTGSAFSDLMKILVNEGVLVDQASFEWVSERMGLKAKVRPGKYKVTRGMNNKELVSLFRSGKQVPVRLTFENVRTTAQLAGIVSRQIEADSASLAELMANDGYLQQYGFNATTASALFIPNTYEFYWNTSAEDFVERMAREYKNFWTPGRKNKAEKAGLTQTEVAVFASIVDQETRKNDEKPIIAGVYLNRYRKGWKLEADPTLVFAAGDFSIQRVLNIHKEIDSPYNTYMYPGLPPGPICIPSISGIDAVLNYRKHDYMFFCAKEDFSGYHSFAVTYSQHLANARRFQRELDRRNIRS